MDPITSAAPAPSPDDGSRRSKLPLIIGGAVLLGVVAFLAIGVFGVHTLFFDEEVAEDGPTFASGAAAAEPDPATEPPAETPVADEADGSSSAPTTAAPTTTTSAVPEIVTAATGTFRGVDHPGQGTVNLLSDGVQTFVRFEDDFSTDNGPDLFAIAYVGGERVELGVLKGNVGSQNYELPADIDPASVDQVAVWCKRFDSTFTIADLT